MKKIAIIGDSVTFGYDGQKNGPPIIAQELARLANLEYVNLSIGGVSFGDGNGISGQVSRVNFKDFDYALIDMGINDYRFPHETIGNMQMALQAGINKIKADNPNTQIFLVTPLQSWEGNNGGLDQKNSMGFSQNDIDDMITRIARLNGLKYVDWRDNPIVTEANHKQTLGDGTVHPTAETQRLMAQRFFDIFFSGKSVTDLGPSPTVRPDQPPQPVPYHDQLVLGTVSINHILPNSTENFKKVFKVLGDLYELENVWQPQTIEYLNRDAYLYLYNTMTLIKRILREQLNGANLYDDEMNPLNADNLIVPKTLILQETVQILNHDFQILQKLLNQISEIYS